MGKKLIEKILFRFGFVPIKEIRIAELKIVHQWKRIILNPVLLKIEQEVARAENQLKENIFKAFYFGNGTGKVYKYKIRKMRGVNDFISVKKNEKINSKKRKTNI